MSDSGNGGLLPFLGVLGFLTASRAITQGAQNAETLAAAQRFASLEPHERDNLALQAIMKRSLDLTPEFKQKLIGYLEAQKG